MNNQIVVIAHNLRSCHNIGSLLRTADGLGVSQVYLTGYTPYPKLPNDDRLPHLADKIAKQISKTALGAEQTVDWRHEPDVMNVLDKLSAEGFTTCALEQDPKAVPLPEFEPPGKVAIIIGREVEGIETAVLKAVDTILEVPMFGKKESFNVVQAAAMALYHIRFR